MSRLAVRVTPRAGHDVIDGLAPDGTLRLRVAAAAADGKANKAVVALLAGALGVRPSAVEIVVGAGSRQKIVDVHLLTTAEIQSRLAAAARQTARRKPNAHST